MIPILYPSTETEFATNGVGRLAECIKCIVTEERNGIFECEFQYPITGKRYADIVEGMYVYCTHDDTRKAQPFEIYARTAPINGIVTFYARHISYKLNNIVLSPFTAGSVTEAMAEINEYSINTNPFTFWTDKSTVANFSLENPASVRGILGGSQGSLLDVYGGEYEFDTFTVKLHSARGTDTDVTIRYGKNLTDLTQNLDNGGTYDAVVPFWKQEDTLVMLDEKVVEGSHGRGKLVPLDLTSEFQEEPTKAQLRSRAQSYLNGNKPWVPDENIKVNFVALWQTTQYKDVAVLQRVKLCDTISVYYPALGITATGVKVIKVTYNVLLDRYDSMELGDARSTFAQTILKQAQESFGNATKNLVTTSAMKKAVDHATKLITGGLGGHIVFNLNADGEPEELLIMDTDDTSTAENVWRFNLGGLGHSHSGYNGPFDDVALTMDGHINASMITVGTLNANIIKAGVLADTGNNTLFNLETGELTMKKGSINLGNGAFTVSTSGALVAKNAELHGDLTSISGGKYTKVNNGRFEVGVVSNGTYTAFGYLDGAFSDRVGTASHKNLAICAIENDIMLGSNYGVEIWNKDFTSLYAYFTPKSSSSDTVFTAHGDIDIRGNGAFRGELSCRSLKVEGLSIAAGTNVSAVAIPGSIGAGGVVEQYYELKIVNGILMNR